MHKFLVRVSNNSVTREVAIKRLGECIATLGDDVEVVEAGRRAYTVQCKTEVVPALESCVANWGSVDDYEGLRPL